MDNNLTIPKIKQKFRDLKSLDDQFKRQFTQEINLKNYDQALKTIGNFAQQQKIEKDTKHQIQKNAEIIYTKSDICQQISKLKPYLQKHQNYGFDDMIQDKQQKQSRQYSEQQYKKLCTMIIYYNRKLCEKLSQVTILQQQLNREGKQKQGWIYQIYYRYTSSSVNQLSKMKMKCGYAVLTEIVQIFESLTFQNKQIAIDMNNVNFIRYLQDMIYDIIEISHKQGIIQIGFINDNQFKLFDRMLFLQKNMSRTSSTRLFQNQLLKSIYNSYQDQ